MEPTDPREPRIPKESPPFADNKWTRTWIMYFESLFRLSVKEAVRQTLEVAVTHSGDLTKDLPVFGDDAAVIKVGTKSGNTNKLVTNTGTNVTGNTVKWDASGNLIDAGSAPGGGSGTVTHTGGALTADQPVFGAGSADIKVGTKTGNTNKLVSNTGTNVTGNTVKWDANGNLIDAGSAPGSGSGTVTSVALTVPAEFSVSGSPVTTSGTLAVSKATQSANTLYAGPTTGSAAAPTFRAVVPADLPLASSSAFGAVKVDGTTITAAGGVISAAGGGGITLPGGVTDLHSWFKADAIPGLSDGDSVNSWPNQFQGQNLNADSTAPIYKTGILNSLPIVRFAAGGGLTCHYSALYNARYSIFLVFKISSLSPSYSAVWGIDSGAGYFVKSTGKTALYYQNTAVYDGSGAATLGTSNFQVVSIIVKPSGIATRVALATDGSGIYVSPPSGDFQLGSQAGQSRNLSGDIAELMIYRRDLTSTERDTVENYLKSKYGL